MNALRFVNKCIHDRKAARASAMLVFRQVYSDAFWMMRPHSPLRYRTPTGGSLYLEPGHSFTLCFWPDVPHYEPEVRDFLFWALRPGDTFIDVGANVGYFSVLAMGLVGPCGRLLAIEANPQTFALLKRNLEKNKFGSAVHCAVTDTPGEVEIHMPAEGDVFSSLRMGGLVKAEGSRSFKVPGKSLDALIAENQLKTVDVIKIDIEGAELSALRSAGQCLERLRPILTIEYGLNTWPNFGATREALEEIAARHRYDIRQFDTVQKKLIVPPAEAWSRGCTNLVLKPTEKRCDPADRL